MTFLPIDKSAANPLCVAYP